MRRQRWRAHLERNGALSERLILAYTAESVADFYRRQGYTVLHVESGRKPRTTERPANKPWRWKDGAIQSAQDFLGLTLPIRIKTTNVAGGRYGAHELRPEGPGVRIGGGRIFGLENATGLFHHITIKAWLSASQASETGWHELCHAMQAERELSALPTPWDARDALRRWNTCHAQGRGLAYQSKPIEVEAREYEAFAVELPLAVEL